MLEIANWRVGFHPPRGHFSSAELRRAHQLIKTDEQEDDGEHFIKMQPFTRLFALMNFFSPNEMIYFTPPTPVPQPIFEFDC